MPAHRDRSYPKGDVPKSGAADNRRDALVRAAAELFRAKGFDGTTIRDIAGAVGMQPGSPFHHFANKHELLLAVMEEGLRAGLDRTRAVVDSSGLAPVERFRRLRADAKLARLMILGAINFSATWYRAKPRAKNAFDLDALADETATLFLHEATP
jgi:AcrR family transcriptional regulator